jgi:zinc D-Ala-D-Ala carboxypeptidase
MRVSDKCISVLRAILGRLGSQRFEITLFQKSYFWMEPNVPPKPRYFKDAEIEGLDAELVAMLDWARGRSGVPFVITSGKRTPEQNERAMGVDASAHIKGLAVDLRCDNSPDRYKMVQALLLAGFKRIGVYNAHVHVDRDPDLPQEVCWIGVSH